MSKALPCFRCRIPAPRPATGLFYGMFAVQAVRFPTRGVRTAKTGAHGAKRNIEQRCDLDFYQAIYLAEHEDEALWLRNLAHNALR